MTVVPDNATLCGCATDLPLDSPERVGGIARPSARRGCAKCGGRGWYMEHELEIIHLAGPVCQFGSVVRQRCQWCGALIDEQDLSRIAIQEDGRAPERRGKPIEIDELGHWEGLVGVSGTNPRVKRQVEPEPSEDGPMPDGSPQYRAPERSCMRLFEGMETQT